ncbi:type II secretion system F family protein [Streptomonospora wellingtoniae]|uniref:Type II secretion system F family protein n=1 Tax=Streptomonospora wellingtoniae TaxID=3075544 RepID=A0ABU2KWE5_9ACTN|nr:type II secretion system F family protein [Streptomonospora sp. DSM 45055]MDT0303619.1 type II secretion system F family protein [Streptomonospora sp. DSM 45055]
MNGPALLLAAVAGCAIGLGLWLLLAVRFSRPSLGERLADPPPPRAVHPARTAQQGAVARLGAVSAPLMAAMGLPGARARRDLAICERDPAAYLAEKATGLVLGVGLPPLLAVPLAAAGVDVGSLWATAAWAVFAGIAWLAPDLSLRDEARKRREQMRHALAAFADLVVVALAGGAGVNGALSDAASAGGGWAIGRIRDSLRIAALRRRPAWSALRDLAEHYDTTEFAELAASLQLAGADGARVRGSLAAKAKTLRTQFLSELDAEAQSATERMSLPVVLLFAGFLGLLGYPALTHILTSL